MKNKKIINAWEEVLPDSETKERMFSNIRQKYQKRGTRRIFKSSKIMATVAAILLLVGLINIQTVIGMINGLFFAPGAGVTRNPVIYEAIDGPIDIETEYGLMTLKFVNKITRDGETILSLYLYSTDIRASRVHRGEEYPLYISIRADGEYIVSDEEIQVGDWGYGSSGENHVSYSYMHENFPDINEFALIIDGVETHISLMHQPDNFALSKENNGITLALSKFNGVTDMLAMDVYDSSEYAADYHVFGWQWFGKYYDENGEEIRMSSGSGGFNPDSPLNYQMVRFHENEREIKSATASSIRVIYQRKTGDFLPVEIPVPKDGETIQVNIEIPIGSYTFRITELRREGGTIYYENNALAFVVERSRDPKNTGSISNRRIPDPWDEDKSAYEQAVANAEAFISHIALSPYDDWTTPSDGTEPKIAGGEIWNFDENAEILKFYFCYAEIYQFGDFNITFD